MAITFVQHSYASVVDSSPGTHEIDTIVVTGTRTEKHLTNSPVRTEVIATEVIEKQHARNMQDALRYAPGLLLRDIHGKTGQSAWIQGLDSDRVLVLVNGEKLSASTGSTVDLSQISTLSIKQIEIIKGASSALYGSEAMGGVINIITNQPEAGWHGQIKGDLGSHNEKNQAQDSFPNRLYSAGNLSFSNNQWDIILGADLRHSDGYTISEDAYHLRGESGYKSNQHLTLGYQFNEQFNTKLAYRGYAEDHTLKDDLVIPGQSPLDRHEQAQSQHLSLANDWLVSNAHALKTSSYVEQYQGQTQADIHRKNEIEFLSQELQHDWSISTSHLLTHGLAYELSELKQTRNNQSELQVNRPRRESVEGFMQWDAMLSPSVEVVSGVRIEHNSAYGVHISPKISAMFSQQLLEKNTNNAIDGRLRLSLGNGYRTPNLKESYFLFDHSNLGYMVVGNPNLEPESSWSAQASYQLFSREWEANAAIFYHDINDLIVTELSERQDGIAIYSYQNINQAQTYGVELSGQFQLNTQMSLNASYTSLQSKNIKTGKTLVNRPEHVIKAGIELGFFNQKTQLSVLGAYQSKEYVDSENSKTSPGFAVFDIKLNQQISSMLNFYAGLDNVFDEYRSPKPAALEGDQRPVPGRTYYAGLSATF